LQSTFIAEQIEVFALPSSSTPATTIATLCLRPSFAPQWWSGAMLKTSFSVALAAVQETLKGVKPPMCRKRPPILAG